MKKIVAFLLLLTFCSINLTASAMSKKEAAEEGLTDARIQSEIPENAPRWTDYVPEKYQNPRTDFTRGSSIAELSVGVVLTDLIITSPIGVPMICHSVTKLKHIATVNKKEKFFNGIEQAQTMTEEQQLAYYPKLLKQCHMTEQQKKKLAKKRKKATK